MSDRDVRLYVEDMLEFCERALAYSRGFGLDALLQDRMRYDAILRNLELIGARQQPAHLLSGVLRVVELQMQAA